MNVLLIIFGVLLLVYPAYLILLGVNFLVYAIVAHNWHEKLFWPFVILVTGTGVWVLLLGLGVL